MSPKATTERPFIAVLDDNPTDLSIASFLIEKEGFTPKLFSTFGKLVLFLNEHRFNTKMILMDNDLPGVMGVDLLKRLKKDVCFKDIPVVMMTGDSTPVTVRRAIAFGAQDYLVKPLDPQVFEGKIKKTLNPTVNLADKQNWVEFRLGQILESKIELKVPGVLIAIGEMSMTIRAEYEVPPDSFFVLETNFFQELGIKAVPLKVESCAEGDAGAGFILKCAVVGLPEADLQRIRIFCKALFRSNAIPAA